MSAMLVVAVILAVVGVVNLLQGDILVALLLLVAAAAVGPGGWSAFRRR